MAIKEARRQKSAVRQPHHTPSGQATPVRPWPAGSGTRRSSSGLLPHENRFRENTIGLTKRPVVRAVPSQITRPIDRPGIRTNHQKSGRKITFLKDPPSRYAPSARPRTGLSACTDAVPSRKIRPIDDISSPQVDTVALTTRIPSAHRTRLLATSAELFWTHGYRATTTRRIAATLGLQQATLYHHVASKEDLLYEICASSLAQLLRAAETAVAGPASPRQRLEAIIKTNIQELLANQREHATMIFEQRGLSSERQADVLATLDRFRQLMRGLITEGQQDGSLRADIDAKYLELGMFNLLTWILVWHRPGEQLTPDALANLVVDIYLNGAATNRDAVTALPPIQHDTAVDDAPRSEAVRTAQRIFSVAARLFRAQGYDATTAREIASVLGIQKASLYHHTRGKAHLLHQVCTTSLRQIREDVITATEHVADPLERARQLVVAHVTSLLRYQDQHAASLLESRALSGDHQTDVAMLRDAHESSVRQIIESAQKAGVLRADVPAKQLGLLLFSLTNRTMLWYRPDGPLRPSQLGEMFAVMFLSGVAAPSTTRHG
jgi:AcrR family transcriptional regulator